VKNAGVKTKISLLRAKLRELEEKKRKLLLNSEEHYREGGDGWHDNASWDALMNKVDIVSAQMQSIREEIAEEIKKPK